MITMSMMVQDFTLERNRRLYRLLLVAMHWSTTQHAVKRYIQMALMAIRSVVLKMHVRESFAL
jgi:hypothetical protein